MWEWSWIKRFCSELFSCKRDLNSWSCCHFGYLFGDFGDKNNKLTVIFLFGFVVTSQVKKKSCLGDNDFSKCSILMNQWTICNFRLILLASTLKEWLSQVKIKQDETVKKSILSLSRGLKNIYKKAWRCVHTHSSLQQQEMRVGDVRQHKWQKSLAVRMLSTEFYADELQYDATSSNGSGAYMILTSWYRQVWMPACAQ